MTTRTALAFLSLIATLSSASLANSAEQCVVEPGQVSGATSPCGDTDASGTVTAADALRTLRVAVGLPQTTTCECTSLSRFADNGDGTVTDRATKLMWEKKEGPYGAPNFENPHDVDNAYTWCERRDQPNLSPDCKNPPPPSENYPFDGTVVTDFLAKLNSEPCFAGHCDWRLPTIAELDGIGDPLCEDHGGTAPCVLDPGFLPLRSEYWSTTFGPYPNNGILRMNTTYWGHDYQDAWGANYVIAVRDGE